MAVVSRWRNETWSRFSLSDTLATDVSSFHTFLAVPSSHLLHLWRHRRSEGDPCSWAKMASPSKASVQLICSVHVAWRKLTQAYEHTHTDTQNMITGKGKCSLWLTSVLPARNPSQALLSLWSSPESWNGVTHFTPVFSDQPFPPLLAGINEPLPFEHPPHPLLRASSRVWWSYASTCASKLSTSSCCSVLSFYNGFHWIKDLSSWLSND